MHTRIKNVRILLVILFFVHSIVSIAAAQKIPVEFFKYFKAKQYEKALSMIDKKKFTRENISTKYYLKGLCYSKLYKLKDAEKNFDKALALGIDFKDVFYEYAQALYAANKLEDARKRFQQSYKVEFKPVASLFYLAQTSQLLEDYYLAEYFFSKITKSDLADKKMKQVAYFKLAGIIHDKAQVKSFEERQEIVDTKVLPFLLKAKEIVKGSAVTKDIKKEYITLKRKYNLDPNLLRNGKILNSKRHVFMVTYKHKYDDNVSNNSDIASQSTTTSTSSYISDTTILAKYRYVLDRWLIVYPEITFNYLDYKNQDNPDVYGEDSYFFNYALKNEATHTIFGEKAAILLYLEHNHVKKDVEKTHEKIFYGKTKIYTVGEKASLFSFGSTTLKFKLKEFESFNPAQDSRNKIYSIDQSINSIVLSASYDMYLPRNPANSTDTTLYSFSYSFPKLFNSLNLSTTVSYAFIDTKSQKEARGVEEKLTGNCGISTTFMRDKLTVGFDYTYIENKSKDLITYTYTKNTYALYTKFSF